MNLFANILFGHIIGDFFLQPKWMAVKKGKSTPICLLHSFICTLAIGAFTNFHPSPWLPFVFWTHFFIDRFSLADQWLKLIGGRTLTGFFFNGHHDIPDVGRGAEESFRETNYRMLNAAFTAIVYFVVDNSAHLMLYWYGYPYFF